MTDTPCSVFVLCGIPVLAYAWARTRVAVLAWQRCAGGHGWATPGVNGQLRTGRGTRSIAARRPGGDRGGGPRRRNHLTDRPGPVRRAAGQHGGRAPEARGGTASGPPPGWLPHPDPYLGGSTGPSPAPAHDGRARRRLEAVMPARGRRLNPQPHASERYPARQAAARGLAGSSPGGAGATPRPIRPSLPGFSGSGRGLDLDEGEVPRCLSLSSSFNYRTKFFEAYAQAERPAKACGGG